MEIVIALALVVVLAWYVAAPLRRDLGSEAVPSEDPRIAELMARKEALYRQIRDAELDREQGKLSEQDWRRHDAELRAEAIEVLGELEP